jgi:hypothetical protein
MFLFLLFVKWLREKSRFPPETLRRWRLAAGRMGE